MSSTVDTTATPIVDASAADTAGISTFVSGSSDTTAQVDVPATVDTSTDTGKTDAPAPPASSNDDATAPPAAPINGSGLNTTAAAFVPSAAPLAAAPVATPVAQPHKIDQSMVDQFQYLKLHGNETSSDALRRIQSRQSHLSAGILFSDPSLNM